MSDKVQKHNKALIIDHDAGARECLRMVLKSNYIVHMTENCESALKAYTEFRPDIIFIDPTIPGLDGLSFIQTIRQENMAIPIVVVTGYISKDRAQRALKMGVTEFIPKPFAVKDILNVAESLLSNESKKKTKFQLKMQMTDKSEFIGGKTSGEGKADQKRIPNGPIGFSGLDSLVTDISQDIKRAEEVIGRNIAPTLKAKQGMPPVIANPSPSEPRSYANPSNIRKEGPSTSISKGSSSIKWIIGTIAVVGIIWYLGSQSDERSIRKPTSVPRVTTSATPAPAPPPVARPAYVRPAVAPNGNSWPGTSGYIPGYKRLNTDGLSVVTVDNTQNDSDVFVKLIYHQRQTPITVRTFFIRAYDKLKLANIRAGLYDIRYKDLDSGLISKCDPFTLEEIQVVDGTQYSVMTLTLYKVRGGNLRMQRISEEQF